MSNLTAKHWMLIVAILGGLGTLLGGAQHGWTDVLNPVAIGGFLVTLSASIGAIFVDKPRDPDQRERATDRRTYEGTGS